MDIFNGLILGFSNSVYCFGICAPAILPFMLAEGQRPIFPLLKFLAGRLIAYIFFALASGFLGIYFEGRMDPAVFAVILFILALWLIAYAMGRLNLNISACRWLGKSFSGKYLPFYSGIAMGINLCPPFLIGLSQTLQMKSILQPLIFFVGFYVGSSIWMLLFLFTGKLVYKKEVQVIGRLTSILVGVWFLGQAIIMFIG